VDSSSLLALLFVSLLIVMLIRPVVLILVVLSLAGVSSLKIL
jgi:hypothetical protein